MTGRGAVVWFTGLSGAGKTTLARAVEHALAAHGQAVSVLDGDVLRRGLCADLGFAPADRAENVRRTSHAAALLADAGVVVLVALIAPYRADRALARDVAGAGRFVEVYLATPLAACEARDPKGLYRRARAGEIAEFTGISAPYETPTAADLVLATHEQSLVDCTRQVLDLLRARHLVAPTVGAAP